MAPALPDGGDWAACAEVRVVPSCLSPAARIPLPGLGDLCATPIEDHHCNACEWHFCAPHLGGIDNVPPSAFPGHVSTATCKTHDCPRAQQST
eukprot:scaffold673_cov410-Prasinococcus_capsulatus_cf.AAC.2